MPRIPGGEAYVCNPTPQERVLAAHPKATCKRAAPSVDIWRVYLAGVLCAQAYSSREAWEAAARVLGL